MSLELASAGAEEHKFENVKKSRGVEFERSECLQATSHFCLRQH